MARDVRDAALLLDAWRASTRAIPELRPAQEPSATMVERPVRPRRVAYTHDLGGITPVDAEVAAICRQAAGASLSSVPRS